MTPFVWSWFACAEGDSDPAGTPDAPTVADVDVEPDPSPTLPVAGEVFAHEPAAIDLLFLVDNSGSMADEQAELVASFPAMLDVVLDLGLSHHVGVVSTDMDDPLQSGRLQGSDGLSWIDEDTPDAEAVFAGMALLGTAGSGEERGLDGVLASLDGPAAVFNTGFRRDGAQYAVVVLSDERDQSEAGPQQAATRLLAEEAHPEDVTFTSIVCPSDCDLDFGSAYIRTSELVGGQVGDIREGDYVPVLLSTADSWWTSAPYTLAEAPLDPSTIVVTVDGIEVDPENWVYDADAVTVRFTHGFGAAPGAEVVVVHDGSR